MLVPRHTWHHVNSTAWAHLDAGNATPDHYSVGLQVQYHGSTSKRNHVGRSIDWAQVRDPQNLDKLRATVKEIPVAPWHISATEQVQLLNQQLQQKLCEAFPNKKSRPCKPYVSEDSWTIRQRRQRLLAGLRALRKHEAGTSVQWALDRWKATSTSHTLFITGIDYMITNFALKQVRATAKRLKSSLQADRKAFIEQTSQRVNMANPSEVYKELACFRAGSKFRKRGRLSHFLCSTTMMEVLL